jgi:hypothetical protein
VVAGYFGTIQWQYSTNGIDYYRAPYLQTVGLISTLYNPNAATTFTTTASTGIAAAYIASNITTDTYFRAQLTNGVCSVVYTNAVLYTIGTAAVSGTITAANATVCSGTGTTLTLTGSAGAIKWYKSTNWTASSPTWTAVTGTSSSLATGNLTVSSAYRAVVTLGTCSTSAATTTNFIVNVSSCTTKTELAENPFAVVAYPNPYSDIFKLDFTSSSEDKVSILVYDMIGKLLEKREVQSSEMNTEEIGNSYPSGVYNVIVTQGENVKTLRVIRR